MYWISGYVFSFHTLRVLGMTEKRQEEAPTVVIARQQPSTAKQLLLQAWFLFLFTADQNWENETS